MRHIDTANYSVDQLESHQEALMFKLASCCFKHSFLLDRIKKGYDIAELAAQCCAEPLYLAAKIEAKRRRTDQLEDGLK